MIKHLDVRVADSVEVLDHRYGCFVRETGHEPFAAARNEHVDVIARADEFAHERTVGTVDELHDVGGQPRFDQCFAHEVGEHPVRADRFVAAAQNEGVPGLHGERRRVDRDVGARFVDHRHNAERYAHFPDEDPRGTGLDVAHGSDRVFELGDLTHALGHTGEDGFGKCEPVEKGAREAFGATGFKVFAVGLGDAFDVFEELRGHTFERVVLERGRSFRRGASGLAGALPHRFDAGLGVKGVGHVGPPKKGAPPSREREATAKETKVFFLQRARKSATLFNSTHGSLSRSGTGRPLASRSISARMRRAASSFFIVSRRAARCSSGVAKTP